MVTQVLQVAMASSSTSTSPSTSTTTTYNGAGIFSHLHSLRFRNYLPLNTNNTNPHTHTHTHTHTPNLILNHHIHRPSVVIARVSASADDSDSTTATALDEVDPTPDDLEYISQIKTVLELLKKNRDMLFGEVKLTIMIEDPREVERKRLLGIDDSDGPTREDLVTALEEVNDGKIPENRVALRMLAEEMNSWPNLEVEASKKSAKSKSLYAKATDTGIDPDVAAKRLNVDWDSAAEIEEAESTDDTEVPPAVDS